MNFKQMFLLEELVDGIDEKGTYKISFMMDNLLCTGDFKLRETDWLLQDGTEQEVVKQEPLIDTYKLWKDYRMFIEEDKEYFIALSEHLKEMDDYGSEKTLTAVFNNMVVFLISIENNLDDYLLADDIPEVIYDFYKYDTYHEIYAVNGAFMEPLSVFRVGQV